MFDQRVPTQNRHALLEILKVFSRRWKIICAFAVVTASGAYLHHSLFPNYEAKGSLIIRTDSTSPLLRVFGRITGAEQHDPYASGSPADGMMKVLKANEFSTFIKQKVKRDIVEKKFPGVVVSSFTWGSSDQIANYILGNYSFKQYDDVIVFYGRSSRPEVAEAVAKWITTSAHTYLVEYETKEVLDTEVYLQKEIEQSNADINTLNRKVDQYRNDPNVSTMFSNAGGNVERTIGKIRDELEMVRVRMNEISILDKDYRNKVKLANRTPDSLEAQDDILKMRGRVVDNLKDLSTELEQLQAKDKALTSRMATLIASLRPQNEQAVYDLKKELEMQHGLRQELLRQVYVTRMYQISTQNKIRMYENVLKGSAALSVTLFKKISLGLFFSLFISLIGIFVWEHLYPVVSSKRDLVQFGTRFLGGLPVMFSKTFNFSRNPKSTLDRMSAILSSGVRTAESTAVQLLAARILHNFEKQTGNRKGVITVVSHNCGEGKTFAANCLSVALGTFGTRVLLIDGDILRSKSENIFGIAAGEGFSEVLEGKTKLPDVIKNTNFKNVYYLNRGLSQPDISSMHSNVYSDFLKEVRSQFDVVIIDTPAFSVSLEALLMTSHSDLGLLIAAANQTKQDDFGELVDSLHSRGIKNLYAILNRTGSRSQTADAYYYDRFNNSNPNNVSPINNKGSAA